MRPSAKTDVRRAVAAAVFAALLAVLSQVSIPLPTGVPLTLQTFAVALCGFVLGPSLGAAATGVYLALGAVGVPVFSGFTGGVGSFAGMTGGFLWGFLPMAALCGLGARRGGRLSALALGGLGLGLCHLCGAAQFAAVTGRSLWEAFLLASAPYLVKDALSAALAWVAGRAVLRGLEKARLLQPR